MNGRLGHLKLKNEGKILQMRKKRVFIGSSTQAIDIAIIIKNILCELGADVTFWDGVHTFMPGDNVIGNLIQAAHQHDAGVFILNKDDQITNSSSNNIQYIPRDNVLIEAGMFIGVLGKEAVALCTIPEVKKASDFEGIETIKYDNRNPDRVRQTLERWLNENVKARHVMGGKTMY